MATFVNVRDAEKGFWVNVNVDAIASYYDLGASAMHGDEPCCRLLMRDGPDRTIACSAEELTATLTKSGGVYHVEMPPPMRSSTVRKFR